MTRQGGKRKGAGRKPGNVRRTRVWMYVSVEMSESIRFHASESGETVSRFLTELLERGFSSWECEKKAKDFSSGKIGGQP